MGDVIDSRITLDRGRQIKAARERCEYAERAVKDAETKLREAVQEKAAAEQAYLVLMHT